MRPSLGEISTRFSLPTVMFSNMRPIGTEIKTAAQASFLNDAATKAKQAKKKTPKMNEPAYDNSPGPNFRRFLSKRNKYLSEEDITVSDSNWTFGQYGLQKRGKQYSSDLMLSDKKKYELMRQNNFGDFLGDILMSKADHMRKQMKSSDSGNSNFSFYSTDGQIMYRPDKGGFVKENECSPPTKGRVYDMRRRFDAIADAPRQNFNLKNSKKKPNASDFDLSRRRDLELAKMLEDEVRKRRNKEKISIRQQLQRMKHLQSDEEEEDFDDEAYFTEPKSREESQSPFFSPDRPAVASDLGLKQSRFGPGASVTAIDSSHLSHWQSSPALLEDSLMKNNMHPSAKGRLSLSSVMSSPDSGAWVQTNGAVDTWLQKQQKMGLDALKKQQPPASTPDPANDGDVSSSPTPAPPPKKERRKTNIYKQLMDIVRKEERHLKNAQRGESNSRDSSYSQRESSPSTCSESSSTSSYSYSDSSSAKNHAKNGVPANKEFGYRTSAPSFQVAFVQPYSPSKSYRPVPFDVVASPYRLPGLQEEGKHLQAEVS
ncbi:uncharacterized protein CDAR_571781 [Caerostris darwini]|uniref:Uncharacterized protein n=1 Tax=Caerostris darwini TaxID=1538125 RepID=A0AAV4W4B1_9ARAC|nr:uncharacterized protein CDAR_571781 [Caerostris darwini]